MPSPCGGTVVTVVIVELVSAVRVSELGLSQAQTAPQLQRQTPVSVAGQGDRWSFAKLQIDVPSPCYVRVLPYQKGLIIALQSNRGFHGRVRK